MTQAQIGNRAVALLYGPARDRRRDGPALREPAHREGADRKGDQHVGFDAGRSAPGLRAHRPGRGADQRRRALAAAAPARAEVRRGAVLAREHVRGPGARARQLPGPHRAGQRLDAGADRRHESARGRSRCGRPPESTRSRWNGRPRGDHHPAGRIARGQCRWSRAGHSSGAGGLAIRVRDARGPARLRRQQLGSGRPFGHDQPDHARDDAGAVRRRLRLPHRVRVVPRPLHGDWE